MEERSANSIQWNAPLTPALSPSDGERGKMEKSENQVLENRKKAEV
jgi:hypothetical protein